MRKSCKSPSPELQVKDRYRPNSWNLLVVESIIKGGDFPLAFLVLSLYNNEVAPEENCRIFSFKKVIDLVNYAWYDIKVAYEIND
ncbi:hypothetical protein, partial [Bacillus sp. MUM 13]|uniref:hypothetical protein n=1 Tax=Bacillus sp. MUM 13 TaxID=1678001 RepID=UPI00196B82CB